MSDELPDHAISFWLDGFEISAAGMHPDDGVFRLSLPIKLARLKYPVKPLDVVHLIHPEFLGVNGQSDFEEIAREVNWVFEEHLGIPHPEEDGNEA